MLYHVAIRFHILPNLSGLSLIVSSAIQIEVQTDLLKRLLSVFKADLVDAAMYWPLDLLDIKLPIISGKQVTPMDSQDTEHVSAGIKGRKWKQITAFNQ